MNEQQDDVMREEKGHLNKIQEVIRAQLQDIDSSLDKNREEIIKQKRYLWENIYELDLG